MRQMCFFVPSALAAQTGASHGGACRVATAALAFGLLKTQGTLPEELQAGYCLVNNSAQIDNLQGSGRMAMPGSNAGRPETGADRSGKIILAAAAGRRSSFPCAGKPFFHKPCAEPLPGEGHRKFATVTRQRRQMRPCPFLSAKSAGFSHPRQKRLRVTSSSMPPSGDRRNE